MSQELQTTATAKESRLLALLEHEPGYTPAALIRRMESGEPLKQEEGITLLGYFTASSGRDMEVAHKRATRAMIKLHAVQQHDLWQFGGYGVFEEYLNDWRIHYNQGRSTALDSTRAIRVWEKCDRETKELLEIQGGVNAVRPLISGPQSIVSQVAKDGTVISLKDEWQTKLQKDYPKADSPHSLFKSYVNDIIHAESTGTTTRQAVREDKKGMAVDRFEVWPVVQEGKLWGVHWRFTPADGKMPQEGQEPCFQKLNKFPKARLLFCRMIGHAWNPARDEEA